MRRKPVVLTIALICVMGLALALWSRSRAETEPTNGADTTPPTPVVAGRVKSGPVPIYLRGGGTVIAFNNVVLRSQITGSLVRVSFEQGQAVHKGDVLAEIDPRPYQAQLDQAIANRDRDQAPITNATANLDR